MSECLEFMYKVGLPLLAFEGTAEARLQESDPDMLTGMVRQAHMFGKW